MTNSFGELHFKPTYRSQRRWLGMRVAAVLSLILFFVYIGLMNDTATQGYKLQSLKDEIAGLESMQTSLQIQLAAEQSLQKTEATIPSLALTPITNIEYLTPTTTAVAVR